MLLKEKILEAESISILNVIETINRNVNMITNDFFEYFDINLRLRIHEINVQNSPNDMRITD